LGKVQDLLDLVDYRRRVGDLYRLGGPDAVQRWRAGRDELFRTHPQSAIEDKANFKALDYFEFDPTFRVAARLEEADGEELVIDTGGEDGAIRYRRAGELKFGLGGQQCSLTMLSLVAYGGGLFLPFKDATSGSDTYGGGRYLFDTVKNTDGLALDITIGSTEVVIDFNFAYNPSCAYNPRWACPLAPRENTLPVAVRAGERSFRQ
jgi:uncharacterized protein (DUF1684 family)